MLKDAKTMQKCGTIKSAKKDRARRVDRPHVSPTPRL